MAKQTPHQYLHSQNAQLLEDREPASSEQGDTNGGEFNENGKRKSIDITRYVDLLIWGGYLQKVVI